MLVSTNRAGKLANRRLKPNLGSWVYDLRLSTVRDTAQASDVGSMLRSLSPRSSHSGLFWPQSNLYHQMNQYLSEADAWFDPHRPYQTLHDRIGNPKTHSRKTRTGHPPRLYTFSEIIEVTLSPSGSSQ
jgi:hypothetical protein